MPSMTDQQPPRGAFDYLLLDPPPRKRKPAAPETPRVPPPPPEHGGRGPRVRIEIEIVQHGAARPAAPVRRATSRIGAAILWFLLALLLVAIAHAHAQPLPDTQRWRSYQQGFERMYQSDDGWTGHSYQQGFTTYYNFNGPDGRTQNCRSWKQGWQDFTECN